MQTRVASDTKQTETTRMTNVTITISALALSILCGATPSAMAQNTHRDTLEQRLAQELSAQGRLLLPQLRFSSRSDQLEPTGTTVLKHVARALTSVPGTFVIEAHVKSSDDLTTDQAMADRRANVVKAGLIALGVPATRLFAVGIAREKSSARSQAPREFTPSIGLERIEIARLQ